MEPDKISFPILKIDEIVDFINKLGYKVDRTIIESNDSDTVVELYCSFLEKLGVVKKDKLKIRFDGMDKFSYTGLHDRPIYILKLFRMSKQFIAEVIGIENFSTSDLFTPNSKRTKRILSGLIRFYKYKQGEKDTYNAMKDNRENSITEFRQDLSKFERSHMNYQRVKNIKEQEQPYIQECNENINSIKNNSNDITSQLNEIEKKFQEKYKTDEEFNEKMKNIDSLNASLISKINQLKGQIVHSPEKLILLIEDSKNNIDSLCHNIQDLENNVKQIEKETKILETLIKNINEKGIALNDYEKIVQNLAVVEKEIYENTEIKQKNEKICNELIGEIDNKIKSYQNLEEYKKEFFLAQKKGIESREEELMKTNEINHNMNKRLNEMMEIHKNQMSRVKQVEEMRSELERVKAEMLTITENEMNTLLNTVKQYANKFGKMLDNAL